jgi:hypothetical protein
MSLIDPKAARALNRFYDGYLHPLSLARQRAAASRAESAPTSVSSYFVQRSQTRLSRRDFELHLGDEHEAARTLEEAWSETPLRDLAKPLMKLAPMFQEVEERSEVSSFIYEMF